MTTTASQNGAGSQETIDWPAVFCLTLTAVIYLGWLLPVAVFLILPWMSGWGAKFDPCHAERIGRLRWASLVASGAWFASALVVKMLGLGVGKIVAAPFDIVGYVHGIVRNWGTDPGLITGIGQLSNVSWAVCVAALAVALVCGAAVTVWEARGRSLSGQAKGACFAHSVVASFSYVSIGLFAALLLGVSK